MAEPRKFQRPWKVVENRESFEVTDASGIPLVYSYFEDDPKRSWAILGGRLTKDEARMVTNFIARQPELYAARQETRESSAAALQMIREAIETLAPAGSLPSQEAVLERYGPEPVHEAQAIVEALQKLFGRG